MHSHALEINLKNYYQEVMLNHKIRATSMCIHHTKELLINLGCPYRPGRLSSTMNFRRLLVVGLFRSEPSKNLTELGQHICMSNISGWTSGASNDA